MPSSASNSITREKMEVRRLKAVELFAAGQSQRTIARTLGVSSMSVSRWHDALTKGGPAALKRRRSPGRPPRLDFAQLEPELRVLYADAVGHDRTAEGFRDLIAARYHVRYDPDHVYRIMRKLGLKDRVQSPRRKPLPTFVRREVAYA